MRSYAPHGDMLVATKQGNPSPSPSSAVNYTKPGMDEAAMHSITGECIINDQSYHQPNL